MCYRFVLVLLFIFVVHSEVRVDTNFEGCSEFFFKGKWPKGFANSRLQHDNEYRYICQNYNKKHYFATLYMTKYRIPLFSAYRLDTFNCKGPQGSRRRKWFIEPQVSNISESALMSTEGKPERWTKLQAVNGDYQNTGYDKGHLNPNFYQCNQGRTATFTLTNAVPQDPCFNRIEWYKVEKQAKLTMQTSCNSEGYKRFFVTGVIPSNITIPSFELDDQPREYNRVNVPLIMWTAACCYNQKDEKGFSFSYTGSNKPDSHIERMSIPDLHNFFDKHGFHNARVFDDDCFALSEDSQTVLQKLANATRVVIAETVTVNRCENECVVYGICLGALSMIIFIQLFILFWCRRDQHNWNERHKVPTSITRYTTL